MGKKTTFNDIREFYSHRGPEGLLGKTRLFPPDKYMTDARVLLGAGFKFNQEWINLPAPRHSSDYWKDCMLTHKDGFKVSAEEVIKRLDKPSDAVKQDPERY